MRQHAVAVDRLTKTYRIYNRPWDRFLDALAGGKRCRELAALTEVSFEVPRGGRLAIIGDNGAGKSTLLSILTGITAPTAGEVRVEGRVSSILELGSSFHPEFSGRQNLVLNAAMHGLSAAEVREKTDAIIEFSELADFIDHPVKCYSTGMVMRLGFAIATQTEPDVLIIDEALSVGDVTFQKKCVDQLEAYCDSGRTLLFCTHAMYYATSLCDRAIWLRKGRVAACGPVLEAVGAYEDHLALRRAESRARPDEPAAADDRPARLTRVALRASGSGPPVYSYGEPWSLEIGWQAGDIETAFHLGVGIDRADGVQICSFGTMRGGGEAFSGRRGYRVDLELPELPVLSGEFSVYVFLLDESGLHVYDRQVLERAFRVERDSYEPGLVRVRHHWREIEG